MKLKLITCILTGLLSQQAIAWSPAGHELLCTIAQQKIAPSIISQINQLLAFKIGFPGDEQASITTNTLPSACNWMDVVTYMSWPSQTMQQQFAQFHYINAVVTPGEDPTLDNAKNAVQAQLQANPYNVITAINSSIKTLMTEKNQIPVQAYALRVLLHTVGDLHQPLHSSDPTIQGTSTKGGNSVLLTTPITIDEISPNGNQPSQYQLKQLHSFWDNMSASNQFGGKWCGFYPEVFSPTPLFAESLLLQAANLLLVNYSNNPDVIAQVNDPVVMDWAQFANLAAIRQINALTFQPDKNQGYFDTTLTNDYITQAQFVTNQQLVIGGLHLSKLINAIFDPTNADAQYVNYVNSVANDPTIKPIEQWVPTDGVV